MNDDIKRDLRSLELLRYGGVMEFNQLRKENPEWTPVLFRAQLRGIDLRVADDLSKIDFCEVKLLRANLSGANLSEADLRGISFLGINLSGADLSEADLSGASLNGAHIRGANFQGANLTEADLQGVDSREANFQGAKLERIKVTMF